VVTFVISVRKRYYRVLSTVDHAYNPSTPETEAGGSQVQGSLGYIVAFISKQERKQKSLQK
jgi:hypothetical protein